MPSLCFYSCRLAKSKDDASTKLCLAALEAKLPIMLRFLGHDDDDVSGSIAGFAHDYVTLLKTMGPLSDQHKRIVRVRRGVIVGLSLSLSGIGKIYVCVRISQFRNGREVTT